MVDAGHFKELDNILQLLQQKSNGGSGVEGEEAADDGDAAGAAGAAEGGGATGGGGGGKAAARQTSPRQIFLFSATLMLPPNAKESNAKKLKAHKAIKSHSTMERLLSKLTFQNALKVIDLSREQLVASRLTQAVLTCMANEKDAYLHLLLRQRPGRVIVFCNAISCLRRHAAPSQLTPPQLPPPQLHRLVPTQAALAARSHADHSHRSAG